MYTQATIACECGCVFRYEFQDGKHSVSCPMCGRVMDKNACAELEEIMCAFSDWNMDILKDASGYGKPKMRAVTLSIADLSGSVDVSDVFQA